MVKTKEYPDTGTRLVMNQISCVYSQESEEEKDVDDELRVSILHQGAGFYFVMETKRWAFDSIDDLIKIITDFKEKAKI